MSIPAVGRRNVLFPPPGVKIRRTIETFFIDGTPTLIAGRDERRVLLTVVGDASSTPNLILAGNPEGLNTPVTFYAGSSAVIFFWGGEELWGKGSNVTPGVGLNVLVQSVFYD